MSKDLGRVNEKIVQSTSLYEPFIFTKDMDLGKIDMEQEIRKVSDLGRIDIDKSDDLPTITLDLGRIDNSSSESLLNINSDKELGKIEYDVSIIQKPELGKIDNNEKESTSLYEPFIYEGNEEEINLGKIDVDLPIKKEVELGEIYEEDGEFRKTPQDGVVYEETEEINKKYPPIASY